MSQRLERRKEEAKAIDDLEEVLAYRKEMAFYYYWVWRPQVMAVLSVIDEKRKKAGSETFSVLDIGCGSAKIPIDIVRKRPVCKIRAVDISRNMLDLAAQDIHNLGLDDRISLSCEDGERLSFDDGFFDLVMCSEMIHHQEDPTTLLTEMKRVARENGVLYITDLVRPPSKFLLDLYVAVFGLPYSPPMRKRYRESLHSAFTVSELLGHAHRVWGREHLSVKVLFPNFVHMMKKP